MPHSLNLQLQVAASARSKPVRAPVARAFVFFDAFDPCLIKQASQSSIERARAEPHSATAHLFDILKNGVAVPRLLRQAQQDKQYVRGKEFICRQASYRATP